MDITKSMENLTIGGDDVATGCNEHVDEHNQDHVIRKRDEIDENMTTNELNTKSEEKMLDVKAESLPEKAPDNNTGKTVDPNGNFMVENEESNINMMPSYKLENYKQNLLVIFNHVDVIGYKDPRIGTDKDVEKMTNTFEKFGFIVLPITNPTKDKVLLGLNELAQKDFTDYGCVAVAVLTHGASKGKLKARNDAQYSERDIIKSLQDGHISLKDKPKIIIIQACRGDNYSKEVNVYAPSNKRLTVNLEDDKFYCLRTLEDDMLVMHSTYPDKVAFRTKNGSYFIQALCEQIDSLAYTEDLESILVHVKRNLAMLRVKKFNADKGINEIKKQMPVITSTLTRKLHLRKYQEHFYETSTSDSDQCVDTATDNQVDFSTNTEQVSDLDTVEDFFELVTNMLDWLEEKEEVELSRDWADPQINLPDVKNYSEQLISFLVAREKKCINISKRREAFVQNHHPQKTTIESEFQKLRSQWAWVVELTNCLEKHLEHTKQYYTFFEDVKQTTETIDKCEKELNSSFSESEITTDYEVLPQRFNDIKKRLLQCKDTIGKLGTKANDIRSVEQRKTTAAVTEAFKAETVCAYKYANRDVKKGSIVKVLNNTDIRHWRVSLEDDANTELLLPSVVLAALPKNNKIIDTVTTLKKTYGEVWELFLIKCRTFKLDILNDGITLAKGWDFPHLEEMGAERRQTFRRALNDHASKLREEYSVANPLIRGPLRELDDLNKVFDDSDRRYPACSMEFEGKVNSELSTFLINLVKQVERLKYQLYEKFVISQDLNILKHLISQYQVWKNGLEVVEIKNNVRNMEDIFKATDLETSGVKMYFDKVMDNWNEMRSNSKRLEQMFTKLETLLNKLVVIKDEINEVQSMLLQLYDLPNHVELLIEMYDEPLHFKEEKLSNQEIEVYQMQVDFEEFKQFVETIITALPQSSHSYDHKIREGLEKLGKDILQQKERWIKLRQELRDGKLRRDAANQVLSEYIDDLQNLKTALKLICNEFNEIQLTDQCEPIRKLLTSVAALTPDMEKVNVKGGRFIKEAKIHASRSEKYTEELTEKIDMGYIRRQAEINRAERLRSKDLNPDNEPLTGSEAVAKELDELNDKHHELQVRLIERLKSIAAANPKDIVMSRLVESMTPRQARSYRQELTIQDLETTARSDVCACILRAFENVHISAAVYICLIACLYVYVWMYLM